MQAELQRAGRKLDRPVHGQGERRLAELHRVQAEQEVVHDRIADQRDFQNLFRRGTALLRRLAQQIPHRGAHRGGHLPLSAGVHHHVRDPAHQVLAEPDLRVHGAGRRHHLARREVADVGRDRRRTDVHGRAVHPVLQAGPRGDDVAVAVHRDGDAPVTGTQSGLESLQHLEVAAQVHQTPLLAERRLDPAQIAGGVVHVGPGDLDESQPHHRIDANRMHFGPLAHHLPVNLAVGRERR